jgi:hypothetical protein
MPVTAEGVGDSRGISNQARQAPDTGIKNFQIFRSETETPSRFKRLNQIEKAAADRKLSQSNAA